MNLPVFLPLQRLVFLLLASSRLVSIHQSGCWLELDLHIIESRCQQRAERCCSAVLSIKAKQGGSACTFGLSCAPAADAPLPLPGSAFSGAERPFCSALGGFPPRGAVKSSANTPLQVVKAPPPARPRHGGVLGFYELMQGRFPSGCLARNTIIWPDFLPG